jgi:hypothetical protein
MKKTRLEGSQIGWIKAIAWEIFGRVIFLLMVIFRTTELSTPESKFWTKMTAISTGFPSMNRAMDTW